MTLMRGCAFNARCLSAECRTPVPFPRWPELPPAAPTTAGRAPRGRVPWPGAREEVDSAVGDAVETLFGRAREMVLDARQPLPRRVNAVALLAQANYERAGETLLSLVDAGPTSELAIAAVQGLGEFLNRDIAKFLLAPD